MVIINLHKIRNSSTNYSMVIVRLTDSQFASLDVKLIERYIKVA